MNKIIVTGATSMLGVALIEVAIKNHIEVYAIIRKDSERNERLVKSPLVHAVYCNLSSLRDIDGLPDDCDALYHFAWAGTRKSERDDPFIQEVNIRYTLDAVELAKKCGCKKFIGAGSQAEYGSIDGVVDDLTKFLPTTAYGVAKFAAGILSKKACTKYGIVHIWGRVFSVYGPHDNEETMINYAINCFARGEVAEFSTAIQMWNYLYETDAGTIFFLLGKKIEVNSEYRIANRESLPLKDYIRCISKIMDSEELCAFAKSDETDVLRGIETFDERLFNDIDYEPQIGFDEGICKILRSKNIGDA